MTYYIGGMPCGNSDLAHFGIKGMKWGVRRYTNPDGTLTEAGKERYRKQQDKAAKKDAKEYARAKMFYGEGAGTRRKQIKAIVDQRSKDPVYKEAFDRHLAEQDMSEHAVKARGERHRKDVRAGTAKTVRGLKNIAVGNLQAASTLSITLASIGAVGYYAYRTGALDTLKRWGETTVRQIMRR